MFYLILATVCSASLVIMLKVIRMRGYDATAAIVMNYVVGAAITFALSPVRISVQHIVSAPWMAMALVTGVSYMLSLAVYGISAERSGVAVTTISGRAAMAIPVVFAFIALGERPTAMKIVLLAAILFALWMILRGNGSRTAKTAGIAAVALPLLVFFQNGLNDTLVQYAKRAYLTGGDDMMFTGTLFLVGAVTGIFYYWIENKGRMPLPSWQSLLWGVALGTANALCLFGILYALETMDGSVFYPLYYAGAVVITTLAGVLAFREKLSPLNYAGIIIALAAIVWLAAL